MSDLPRITALGGISHFHTEERGPHSSCSQFTYLFIASPVTLNANFTATSTVLCSVTWSRIPSCSASAAVTWRPGWDMKGIIGGVTIIASLYCTFYHAKWTYVKLLKAVKSFSVLVIRRLPPAGHPREIQTSQSYWSDYKDVIYFVAEKLLFINTLGFIIIPHFAAVTEGFFLKQYISKTTCISGSTGWPYGKYFNLGVCWGWISSWQ